MENNIKKYIMEEINKLKLKDDQVDLKCVYPTIIESVIGILEDYDINGYECDYWGNTEEYEVFGTMVNGTATITKK